MKVTLATLAMLAATVSAQLYGQQPIYGQQPQQPQPPQQYQQYPQYAPPPVQNKYSPAEAQAWYNCVNGFLDQINLGHEGSKPGCSFWTCLEQTASQYNRGGALAAVGQGVNLVCKASGLIPGNWF